MNKILNVLMKISVAACSTVALLTAGETRIQAATITGDFQVLPVIGGLTEAFVIGSFEGEDFDENGILSKQELSNLSANFVGANLRLIPEEFGLDDFATFELNLESLNLDFFFGEFAFFTELVPNSGTCVICIREEITVSEDLAYFYSLEYFDIANTRFSDRILFPLISFAEENPPTVEISLNPQNSQSVPEPNVLLGILTVFGLGSKLKKGLKSEQKSEVRR